MQTVQQAAQQRNTYQQKHAELTEAKRLCPGTAWKLADEIVFHFARLALASGTKHPIYRPWRSQLGKLINRSKKTISRLLGVLVGLKLLIKLPQDKDFKRNVFGPLQLAPSRLLWVLIRAKIQELARRKRKPSADSNRGPFSASISSPSKERDPERVREAKKERENEDERLFRADYGSASPDPAMMQQLNTILNKPKG